MSFFPYTTVSEFFEAEGDFEENLSPEDVDEVLAEMRADEDAHMASLLAPPWLSCVRCAQSGVGVCDDH